MPLTSAWNQLRSIASSIWNGMKLIAASAWNGIRSVVSSVVSGIRAVVTSAWNSIKAATSSAFNSVKSTVTSIWNSIKSTLSGLASQAATWGRNLLNNFISGIKSRFSALVKVVKDAAGTVAAYLGFHSPAEKGPGADADKWFVNLMEMLENFIRIRVPHLRAVVLDASGFHSSPYD
jgi:phage-related protein